MGNKQVMGSSQTPFRDVVAAAQRQKGQVASEGPMQKPEKKFVRMAKRVFREIHFFTYLFRDKAEIDIVAREFQKFEKTPSVPRVYADEIGVHAEIYPDKEIAMMAARNLSTEAIVNGFAKLEKDPRAVEDIAHMLPWLYFDTSADVLSKVAGCIFKYAGNPRSASDIAQAFGELVYNCEDHKKATAMCSVAEKVSTAGTPEEAAKLAWKEVGSIVRYRAPPEEYEPRTPDGFI